MTDFSISERPKCLEEIAGHSVLKQQLKTAVQNSTLPQALMFYGPSGCGKSSFINALVKELKVDELNIHNVDCGTSAKIEVMRDLIDTIEASPFGGRSQNRVYILEEVHRLSSNKAAQESLLKTLESLPKGTYFLACTTNPEMLLEQFLNRFTQYTVCKLPDDEMLEQVLKPVHKKYQFQMKKSTVMDIIRVSKGVPRTALKIVYSLHDKPLDMQIVPNSVEHIENKDLFDIFNKLVYSKASSLEFYKEIVQDITKLDKDYEKHRKGFIGMAEALMINPKDVRVVNKAACLIDCMRQPCDCGIGVLCKNIWMYLTTEC